MRRLIALAVVVVGLVGASAQTAEASSSCWYSVRGCVSVSGYYRPSSGTYVFPYYRNYPSYRSYGFPSYRSYSYPSWRW